MSKYFDDGDPESITYLEEEEVMWTSALSFRVCG
jgi:hypothetical protein